MYAQAMKRLRVVVHSLRCGWAGEMHDCGCRASLGAASHFQFCLHRSWIHSLHPLLNSLPHANNEPHDDGALFARLIRFAQQPGRPPNEFPTTDIIIIPAKEREREERRQATTKTALLYEGFDD